MALPTWTKSGVPTVTFSRADSWPRRLPGDERQLVAVSDGGTVRVATLSAPEEFIVLDFQANTALPAADYANVLAFLKHASINFRANAFTFTDTDSVAYNVRYWGEIYAFVQSSSGRYQGTLTLRREIL